MRQVALGGISQWTVGLIATFMAVSCTIAADTGAYAFGKTLGRTQLISISPKKTVEGALGGLACSTAVSLAFWRFLGWPAQARAGPRAINAAIHTGDKFWVVMYMKLCTSWILIYGLYMCCFFNTGIGWLLQAGVAVGLAWLIFFASLCGDLIESVMKRDAGLKDAGDLIPGHGGLLDRFDSYIFTGAIVYFILRFVTPLFGL